MDKATFSSSRLFLSCKVSNCMLRVPRMLVLNFYNKFHNSTLVASLVADLKRFRKSISVLPLQFYLVHENISCISHTFIGRLVGIHHPIPSNSLD